MTPERLDGWNVGGGNWRHPRLARERGGDEGRKHFLLLRLPGRFAHLEFRHHGAREQFERFANVRVPVVAALLHEDDLIDAGILVAAKMRAHLIRRADAAVPGVTRQRVLDLEERDHRSVTLG